MTLVTTYWSLGSNIEPEKHIAHAVKRFRKGFADVKISNLYQSPANGFVGDDFLNLVIAFETDRPLRNLLAFAKALEQEAGRTRVRRGRFDSRTLDVDLVMYGSLEGQHCGQKWPADDILQAAYVLKPMVDVAGSARHPVLGRSFRSLWKEFDQQAVPLTKLDRDWL